MIDEAVCWNKTLAAAWSSLLKEHGSLNSARVVEIGPGYGEKLALALAGTEFCGSLLLLEPNDRARKWALNHYRQLLPEAVVEASESSVGDPPGIVGDVDLLVSNHILDDLLFNAAVPAAAAESMFAEMGAGSGCSTQFVDHWRVLLADPGRLDDLSLRVVEDMVQFIQVQKPGLVIFNEYGSWRQSTRGLGEIHGICMALLRTLRAELRRRLPRGPNGWRIEHLSNAYWLVS